MKQLTGKTYDEERALYGCHGLVLQDCLFDGPADGESALKTATDIVADHCRFHLRYPFWHGADVQLNDCVLTDTCRAALWYCESVSLRDTKLHGIKALRECDGVTLTGCDIDSPEFGWNCRGVAMENCTAAAEYFMLRSEKLRFSDVHLTGKYSFQYIRDAEFDRCIFDTKDAFWHAQNVTVRDSVLRGEYLSWYSDSLTLIRCVIDGTQPLCCCKNLRLIDCEMRNADLCFERSEVNATISTPVISIKNPRAGCITVPAVGTVIRDEADAAGIVQIAP